MVTERKRNWFCCESKKAGQTKKCMMYRYHGILKHYVLIHRLFGVVYIIDFYILTNLKYQNNWSQHITNNTRLSTRRSKQERRRRQKSVQINTMLNHDFTFLCRIIFHTEWIRKQRKLSHQTRRKTQIILEKSDPEQFTVCWDFWLSRIIGQFFYRDANERTFTSIKSA